MRVQLFTLHLEYSSVAIMIFYLWGTLESQVYVNNPHSLEEVKISGTKLEPFCGELLDTSSGDVQPAR